MSYDSKPGKRKLTSQKGKNKSSPKLVSSSSSSSASSVSSTAALLDETSTGTTVNLDACIWQENLEAGLVVMNIKWRGKTYCGAFIDIEKHNWQPPRVGENTSPETDHFTRGRNKRSLNSESDKVEEDTPTKKGRSKGKKKRGPPPGVKKIKKNSETGNTAPPPSSPTNSVASTEETKCPEPEEPKSNTQDAEITEKVEISEKKDEDKEEIVTDKEAEVSDKSKVIISKAPDTPILPETPEPTAQSVINNYSPHSKKLKTSTPTSTPTNSNKLTPIPKELTDSVIRSFNTKSPLNMLQGNTPPTKPFLNPRGLGLSQNPLVSSHGKNLYQVENEVNSSKPQVIVKPERREIKNDVMWSLSSMSLPVLKPQPHFSSPEMRGTPLMPNAPGHPGLSSANNILPPSLVSSSVHANLGVNSTITQSCIPSPSFYKDPKNLIKPNEHLLAMGHAFKNASFLQGLKSGNGAAANPDFPFGNLHRQFYQGTGDQKTEVIEQGGVISNGETTHRQTSQEAAQSLLQLSQPFQKTNPIDQLQYLSRLGGNMMPTTVVPHPATPPSTSFSQPQRFPPDTKEAEMSKLMSLHQNLGPGPKFPIVGKFR